MQAAQAHNKCRAFMSVTDRVANGIEANEELLISTEEARHIMRGRQHLIDVATDRTASHKRRDSSRFTKVVANGRLRDIALAQKQEIEALKQEKARWVQRSFPSFETGPGSLKT